MKFSGRQDSGRDRGFGGIRQVRHVTLGRLGKIGCLFGPVRVCSYRMLCGVQICPYGFWTISARRHDGTTARRHDGTTARRHDGTTARRHDGTTARRHDGTTARRHDGTTARRHDGTTARRHDGTTARRHDAQKESPCRLSARASQGQQNSERVRINHKSHVSGLCSCFRFIQHPGFLSVIGRLMRQRSPNRFREPFPWVSVVR